MIIQTPNYAWKKFMNKEFRWWFNGSSLRHDFELLVYDAQAAIIKKRSVFGSFFNNRGTRVAYCTSVDIWNCDCPHMAEELDSCEYIEKVYLETGSGWPYCPSCL